MEDRPKRKSSVHKKRHRKHFLTKRPDRDARYLTHVKIFWAVAVLVSAGVLLAIYLIATR